MKERGVLFNAPMVRALLDGSKTQTRRAIKLPHMNPLGKWEPSTFGGPDGGRTRAGETVPLQGSIWHTRTGDCLGCQHGVPGDRLWVRETWMADPPIDDSWPSTQFAGCRPRDHSLIPEDYRKPEHCLYRATETADLHGWTPGIHMFRWASRITLELTGVRAERLQDISEADAIAEGITHSTLNDPRVEYRWLWESINGPGSWDTNPWVWVIEFKRV